MIPDYTVETALAQIDKCDFECEGGPLRNNTGYRWLKAHLTNDEPLGLAYVVHDRGWLVGQVMGHQNEGYATRAAADANLHGPCEGDGEVYVAERTDAGWVVIARVPQ